MRRASTIHGSADFFILEHFFCPYFQHRFSSLQRLVMKTTERATSKTAVETTTTSAFH